MPELPEVQTVCDVIGPQVKGRMIESIRIADEKLMGDADTERRISCVCGARILGVLRRGKYILFPLSNGLRMTVHLRMTGGLLIAPGEYPRERHTRAVFMLDDGKELRFTDQRRFGRIWLTEEGKGEKVPGLMSLGIEPFDGQLTAQYMKERLSSSGRKIKDCLLDQTIIAGIGNIYSDEILFRAGIHPAQRANTLTDEKIKTLVRCIPEAMQYYVEKNRIDAEAYFRTGGREYRNTPYLQVYGRAGKECMRCGEKLIRERIAGRGSVFCPSCQRLDEKD